MCVINRLISFYLLLFKVSDIMWQMLCFQLVLLPPSGQKSVIAALKKQKKRLWTILGWNFRMKWAGECRQQTSLPPQALCSVHSDTFLNIGLFAHVQVEVSINRTIQQSAWKEQYKNTSEFTSAATRFIIICNFFLRFFVFRISDWKGENSSETKISVNK